jgi:hypothetical protein
VVFFLAAITRRLFSRVLGADDAPFGSVMGKGGRPRFSWVGDSNCWSLSQRCDDSSRVGLWDAEPLGEGGQGASGGIAQNAEGRQ